MDTKFSIRTNDWQLDLDKGVTELYVDANFAIGPFVWQLELDQDVTEFYVEANFFHRTNPLAIRIRPLHHRFLRDSQLCHQTN